MALIDEQTATTIPVMPKEQKEQYGRTFQEIVVEYPSYSIYPEYKGKPYFSIKYTEKRAFQESEITCHRIR